VAERQEAEPSMQGIDYVIHSRPCGVLTAPLASHCRCRRAAATSCYEATQVGLTPAEAQARVATAIPRRSVEATGDLDVLLN
jgi:hypothetical protein